MTFTGRVGVDLPVDGHPSYSSIGRSLRLIKHDMLGTHNSGRQNTATRWKHHGKKHTVPTPNLIRRGAWSNGELGACMICSSLSSARKWIGWGRELRAITSIQWGKNYVKRFDYFHIMGNKGVLCSDLLHDLELVRCGGQIGSKLG